MTLQEKKEQLAHSNYPAPKDIRNVICGDLQALGRKAFISGFDEADPIGLLEFAVLNNYFCNDSNKERITWAKNNDKPITTEELFVKFLEYKQTLKH